MNKVSIIVPVYNIEKFLPICLESVISQTYKNIEIILVDDGSSDESGKICDSFASRDARIRVIHKMNGGLVSARKAGLQIALGEYVMNIDGDDYVDQKIVEELVSKAISGEFDFVQCGYKEIGTSVIDRFASEFEMELTKANRIELLKKWMVGTPSIGSQIFTKLFRKDILKKSYMVLQDDMSYGEDYMSFLIYLSKSTKVASINKNLYYYRIRENSLSHDSNKFKQLLSENDLDKNMISYIDTLYPEMERDVISKWIIYRKVYSLSKLVDGERFCITKYKFLGIDKIQNKNIAIYGAGAVGRDYITQLSKYVSINIVAWVDKNFELYKYDYRDVEPISSLFEKEYDYILLAIREEQVADEIRGELINLGIRSDVILWENV